MRNILKGYLTRVSKTVSYFNLPKVVSSTDPISSMSLSNMSVMELLLNSSKKEYKLNKINTYTIENV